MLAATPTRLVVFESPTNPVLKVADLERITALAQAHGALTLLDNTLAGLHNHGEFDVDLYVHSLTKFASGHGDVMGGAVIGRRELIDAVREDFTNLGPTLDPHAAFLLLRGLKTYFLRWDAQCGNAQRVAEFLAARPEVEPRALPGPARRSRPRAGRPPDGRLRHASSPSISPAASRPARASPRRSSSSASPRAWARPSRWWCRRRCSSRAA